MKSIEIKGTKRESLGTLKAKKFREYGLVPCVVYGGKEPLHFASPVNEFKKLVYTADAHFVIIDLEGKKIKAIMQEIQFHPVSEQILHVDFLEVADNKRVAVEIPVQLIGVAPGVRMGGRLIQKLRRLKIKGLPAKLPEHIEVDINALEVGSSVKVGDLNLAGLSIMTSANTPIVSVLRPRTAVEITEDDDDEEGAEGVEGAATAEGGDAPAAEGGETPDAKE